MTVETRLGLSVVNVTIVSTFWTKRILNESKPRLR
jgi:hypothetical protein